MRVLATFVAVALAGTSFAANTTLPVPKGEYTVDKAHTSLLFKVNHLGFSTFTGRFTKIDVKLETDPANLANSKVEATIDPRSIATDNAPDGFLAMLGGQGWLEAEQFPTMTYKSTKVEVVAPNKLRVTGDLTLHGATKPVVLDAKYNGGYAGHPMDPHARIGFSATGKFKRSDFGITAGIPSAAMPFGVSDEVQIVLETELSGPPLAK